MLYRLRNAAIVTMVLLISAAAAAALLAHCPVGSPSKAPLLRRRWLPRPPTVRGADPGRPARMATTRTALGRIWQSDRYFQGGGVFESHDHPIFGTREPKLYHSRREGAFAYDIPLPPGVYELRLYFAETLYGENNVAGGGESSRIFNVWINGKRSAPRIRRDRRSRAQHRRYPRVQGHFPGRRWQTAPEVRTSHNPPLVCAIEITPGIPGKLRPDSDGVAGPRLYRQAGADLGARPLCARRATDRAHQAGGGRRRIRSCFTASASGICDT